MSLDLETLKKELNPEQYRAVTSIDGAILIIAGAGSGKTEVLTQRIYHFAKIDRTLDKFLVLTFSKLISDIFRFLQQFITMLSIFKFTQTLLKLKSQKSQAFLLIKKKERIINLFTNIKLLCYNL